MGKVDNPYQISRILSGSFSCHLATDNESVIIPMNHELEQLLREHGIRSLEHVGRYDNMLELVKENEK
jgi:hypothetical protein